MANLLETIKQNRDQLAGQQAPMTDETQKTQTLLRAKSGRAASGGEAPASSLQEQVANSATTGQLQGIGSQVQLQQKADETAAAGQQQAAQTARNEIDQAKRFNTIQNNMKANSILNDLSRDRGALDLDKERGRLEQATFILAMQDKQYTDQLQDIGRRNRLDDQTVFKNEMARIAFQDNLDLLKTKLGNQDVISASDRDFKKAMSDLSIEDAVQIASTEGKYAESGAGMNRDLISFEAKQKAKQANGAAQAQGLSGLMSGGIGAVGAYEKGQDKQSNQAMAQGGLDE